MMVLIPSVMSASWYELYAPGSTGNRARHLPGADVETGPDIDVGDRDNQGRKRRLVVVPRRLVPDLVGHRVRPLAEPRGGLGERLGGAFGIGEKGGIRTGRHCEEPRVGLAGLL